MLSGVLSQKIFAPQDKLEVKASSCLRQRFGRSSCRHCFEICPSGALSWGEQGLRWQADQCQGCLQCVARCPSGALQARGLSLTAVVEACAEIKQPVLGCQAQGSQGQVRLPCLGVLTDPELLLALVLLLHKPLQLNLIPCADCVNAAMLAPLQVAVLHVQQKFPVQSAELTLVSDPDQLVYREPCCDRRDFFRLVGRRSKRTGYELIERLQSTPGPQIYAHKSLPLGRRWLLQVLPLLNTEIQSAVRTSFPQRQITSSCRACTGCVGICPTGALTAADDFATPPDFAPHLCTNCGLCRDFCTVQGLVISTPPA